MTTDAFLMWLRKGHGGGSGQRPSLVEASFDARDTQVLVWVLTVKITRDVYVPCISL